MRTIRRRSLIVGSLAAAAFPAKSRAAGFAGEIDAAARRFMARHGVPGLVIGVTRPAGRSMFAYGAADPARGAPVDARTLFEIGSISKTFTTALAALAVADGAMRWEDAPGRHVPEVGGPGTDRLTLRDLATHATGGMPLQLPPGTRTWAEAAAWFRGWTPLDEPGVVRAYANPSIGLLGVVTARALGEDFAALVRRRVLAPLGLDDTWYAVAPADMPRYAQGRTRDDRPVRMGAAPLAAEAYGVRTTAADLLRFVEAQMGLVAAPANLVQALRETQLGWLRVGSMTQALIWEWFPPPVTDEAVLAGSADAIVFRPHRASRVDPPLAPPAGALVAKTGGTAGFGAYAAFTTDRREGFVILANRNHPTAARLDLAADIRRALAE
jgi:beta-lactamase class C